MYLEATLNDHLRNLLGLTPGVIRNRHGLISQHIPFDEGLELLKMRPLKDPPQLGKWVQVLRGSYKGDVGYVLLTTASDAHLLLIPRLTPPDASHPKRKRFGKRSTTLKLFDHETFMHKHDVQPLRIDDNIYSFRNDRFEYGLIVRRYSFDSLSTAVSTIPLELFCLFLESRHPKLIASKSAFPRPSEWNFAEGDKVYYLVDDSYPPSFKSGVISTLREDLAELDTDEGILYVRWLDFFKVIVVGDYVEVTGGMHKGQRGWVVNMDPYGQVAEVVRSVDEEKPFSESTPEVFEVHANVLRLTAVPHVLGKHRGDANVIPRAEKVPWIGVEVIIIGAHAQKGYLGIIKNVLCNQSTSSGIRVVMQITSPLVASAPFMHVVVDYNQVVEAR